MQLFVSNQHHLNNFVKTFYALLQSDLQAFVPFGIFIVGSVRKSDAFYFYLTA